MLCVRTRKQKFTDGHYQLYIVFVLFFIVYISFDKQEDFSIFILHVPYTAHRSYPSTTHPSESNERTILIISQKSWRKSDYDLWFQIAAFDWHLVNPYV